MAIYFCLFAEYVSIYFVNVLITHWFVLLNKHTDAVHLLQVQLLSRQRVSLLMSICFISAASSKWIYIYIYIDKTFGKGQNLLRLSAILLEITIKLSCLLIKSFLCIIYRLQILSSNYRFNNKIKVKKKI